MGCSKRNTLRLEVVSLQPNNNKMWFFIPWVVLCPLVDLMVIWCVEGCSGEVQVLVWIFLQLLVQQRELQGEQQEEQQQKEEVLVEPHSPVKSMTTYSVSSTSLIQFICMYPRACEWFICSIVKLWKRIGFTHWVTYFCGLHTSGFHFQKSNMFDLSGLKLSLNQDQLCRLSRK